MRPVSENGTCDQQECKLRGYEMMQKMIKEHRMRGEKFDPYDFARNKHEDVLEKNIEQIAQLRKKMAHPALAGRLQALFTPSDEVRAVSVAFT